MKFGWIFAVCNVHVFAGGAIVRRAAHPPVIGGNEQIFPSIIRSRGSMDNFELKVCCESGEDLSFAFDTPDDLIAWMAGPDISEEVNYVMIEAMAEDGRRVEIMIRKDTGVVTAHVFDVAKSLAA